MKWWRGRLLPVRAALVALGVALVVLALCNPFVEESREEVNKGGRVEIGPVSELQGLTQSFAVASDDWTALNVRLEDVTEAEELTLTLAVCQSGEMLAQADFPLTGLKKRSVLTLPLPHLPSGSYELEVTARGVGSTALNGRKAETPALLAGQPLTDGIYLRLIHDRSVVSAQAIYLGLTLVLLGLVPLGRGKEAQA